MFWGAVLVIASLAVSAQETAELRVMAAVRAALAPALPFSDTDPSGTLPVDGTAEALWMVRPAAPGDQSIEVIANPLNAVNQVRAARAMAQIQNNIESAQRRAADQYEHAVAEAKRTGKSQEVDGVTLGDEGVEGAKIDADSHVLIDIAFNQPSYQFALSSSLPPASSTEVAIPGAVAVIAVASHSFRDQHKTEQYAEAQTLVFLGRVAVPEVQRLADHSYAVTAVATPSSSAPIATLVLYFRGNDVLIAEMLRKTDWNSLLELLQ